MKNELKVLFAVIGFCVSFSANSQYYFTDIVAHQQSEAQYKLLIAAKVKQIKAASYDAMGETSDNFSIEQNIKDNGKRIVTKTLLPNSGTTVLENNYEDGKLMVSVNSSVKTQTTLATTTTYTYNTDGRITAIVSQSLDTSVTASNLSETHLWYYNDKGMPTKMLKIKFGKDTMQVLFTYEEKGNVAEEKWVKGGQTIENYYYYYSDNNLLTDVVRYNSLVKKLLPDFIYEYDDNGRVIKMTQAIKGGTDYLVWKYTYNEKGLKQTESCYNKRRELEGKVVYSYSE